MTIWIVSRQIRNIQDGSESSQTFNVQDYLETFQNIWTLSRSSWHFPSGPMTFTSVWEHTRLSGSFQSVWKILRTIQIVSIQPEIIPVWKAFNLTFSWSSKKHSILSENFLVFLETLRSVYKSSTFSWSFYALLWEFLDTFQIFKKKSWLSGNFPDCHRAFQVVWISMSLLHWLNWLVI